MSEKILLTVEEAAERLSIGRTKAFELVGKGALESVMIGRRRRVPVEALEHFVAGLLRDPEANHPSATMTAGWSHTPPADFESEPVPMSAPAGGMAVNEDESMCTETDRTSEAPAPLSASD